MTDAMAFQPIEATLRDGRRVRIRAIRPADRDEVVQAFDLSFRQACLTSLYGSVKADSSCSRPTLDPP
jgi:hypothetical protein